MSRPTRVALVTYAMRLGGVETYMLRLAKYLQRHGLQVEIVTTQEPGEWFEHLPGMGLTHKHIPGYYSSSAIGHALRVGRALAKGNYDVIFLNNSYPAQAAIAMLANRVVVIPVLHGDIKYTYDTWCANSRAWNVAVAVSPKVCQTAKARVAERPVVCITNGVDMPSEEGWLRRRRWDTPVRLVCLGRLEDHQKRVMLLPDIMKRCLSEGVDARLAVVGEGPHEQRFLRKVRDYGLDDYIDYRGPLPYERVYDVLMDSHVLLLPSTYEGLPTSALEAQACGCVPVASRLPGINDVAISDGETGILVAVDDVPGFVGAIASLYCDPARWAQMSKAGHDWVRQHFSTEVMGEAYLRLISEARAGRYPLARSRRLQPPADPNLVSYRELLPEPVCRWLQRVRFVLRSLLRPLVWARRLMPLLRR